MSVNRDSHVGTVGLVIFGIGLTLMLTACAVKPSLNVEAGGSQQSTLPAEVVSVVGSRTIAALETTVATPFTIGVALLEPSAISSPTRVFSVVYWMQNASDDEWDVMSRAAVTASIVDPSGSIHPGPRAGHGWVPEWEYWPPGRTFAGEAGLGGGPKGPIRFVAVAALKLRPHSSSPGSEENSRAIFAHTDPVQGLNR